MADRKESQESRPSWRETFRHAVNVPPTAMVPGLIFSAPAGAYIGSVIAERGDAIGAVLGAAAGITGGVILDRHNIRRQRAYETEKRLQDHKELLETCGVFSQEMFPDSPPEFTKNLAERLTLFIDIWDDKATNPEMVDETGKQFTDWLKENRPLQQE